MLTSKQRAFLRSLAAGRDSVFQIGKGGLSDNQIEEIDRLLEKHELVKIHVLENALVDSRTMCETVAESIDGCEPVCAIGRKFVIYKRSKEHRTIDLTNLRIIEPKKKEIKKKPVAQSKTARSYSEKSNACGKVRGAAYGRGKERFGARGTSSKRGVRKTARDR